MPTDVQTQERVLHWALSSVCRILWKATFRSQSTELQDMKAVSKQKKFLSETNETPLNFPLFKDLISGCSNNTLVIFS